MQTRMLRIAIAAILFAAGCAIVHAQADATSVVSPVAATPTEQVVGGPMSCSAMVGGINFDLSALRGSSDIVGQAGDSYQYTMNVCGQVGGVCSNKEGTPMICQANGGLFESVVAYAGTEKSPPPAWDPIDPANPAKGPKITFRNGDYCWASPTKTREAIISFPCDPSAAVRPGTFSISESPACTFLINYPNAATCGDVGGGMSGGSAFLLTIFIIGIVYIAGGCIYKRKRMGTVGMRESFPNIDFWASIPGLVKDGIIFTRSKITGQKPVARHNYDAL